MTTCKRCQHDAEDHKNGSGPCDVKEANSHCICYQFAAALCVCCHRAEYVDIDGICDDCKEEAKR